jgi:Family of unknown function (DUF5691)
VTGVSFDDLATVATVGVDRKGLAVSELAGPAAGQAAVLDPADPAAALLDAAALLTVARRAGVRPGAERPGRGGVADPGGPARELSARAAGLLRQLGSGDAGAEAFAAADAAILVELLTAAGRAGYALPAPLLPGLLDAAVRDAGLRPAVVALLGARGHWLAGHRADWRRAVALARAEGIATSGGAAGNRPEPLTAEAGRAAWRAGDRDERRALLAEFRRRDPAAGRELLRAGWAGETGFDRAALLSLLRHGLSAADEDFLEAALDDRAGGVRDEARRLLGWLPGTAFRQREALRAAPVLRVERHGLRRRLAVTLPGEPDAAAARDGVPAASPVDGIGAGGWRLIHVLAGAPLTDWTGRLGLSPAELVALPVADDRGAHVQAAWRLAVARQLEAAELAGTDLDGTELTAWALALLSADASRPARWSSRAWPDDAALTAALPAAIRADRAAARLKGARPDDRSAAYTVTAGVTACPAPWSPALADAVTGALTRAADRPDLLPLPRALLRLAGRGLPATGPRDYAAALTRLAAARPQDWTPLLLAAAETIALRRAFLAEL